VDAIKKKRPEEWRIINWFLFHDNAPTHLSVLVKNFLAKDSVTTLDYSPYFPDQDPVDLYLFPRIKLVSK
jgi:hypothetical protein